MEIQTKKKIELMQNSTQQSGFSLLELMIVFALLAMLGALVVPNIFRVKPAAVQKEFLSSLDSLIQQTVARSVMEQKVHQVYFNIKEELVQMREKDPKSIERSTHKQFTQVKDAQYITQIAFSKDFKIKNFFINGIDEVNHAAQLEDVLFYIMPDGTSQPVAVNIIHEHENAAQDSNFSFVINPFYARMSVYETFQAP